MYHIELHSGQKTVPTNQQKNFLLPVQSLLFSNANKTVYGVPFLSYLYSSLRQFSLRIDWITY